MIPRGLANTVVVVVLLVWAVTITAPYWQPGAPAPHPAIYAVFLAVVGGALRLRAGPGEPGTLDRVVDALRSPKQPTPAPPGAHPEGDTTP